MLVPFNGRIGARGGTRTRTPFLEPNFKSGASTDSATRAKRTKFHNSASKAKASRMSAMPASGFGGQKSGQKSPAMKSQFAHFTSASAYQGVY